MRTPRHDPAEVRRLLELREAEGLTFKQLSERSGVAIHVLTYRASQDRLVSRREPVDSTAFVEVVDAPGSSADSLEIIGPRGHRVVVTSAVDAGLLDRVLRALPC